MKTCSEMTSSVFLRIEEYKIKQKKRKAVILAVTPAIGILIAVMTVMLFAPNKTEIVTPTPLNTAIQSNTDKRENKIVVNKIDSISLERMYICLLCEDFVPMTKDEMNDYYGINVFPEVPVDLTEWESENNTANYGIYRRDGGMGEVYHDAIVLNYSDEDISRSVNIELAKGKFPFCCYGSFDEHCEKSIISGVEANIGQTDSGYYLIEMMYKDVGFRIIAEGLTTEEIEMVVGSLVD